MLYFCCDRTRRDQIQGSALNGIDFLEVLDGPQVPLPQRQRTLFVHFINPLGGVALAPANISIEGGVRITAIAVTAVAAGPQPNVITATVDQPGDFSTYTLRLVDSPSNPGLDLAKSFDRMFSSVDFSFKVACPSDFDCRPVIACPPTSRDEPDIDYLSKDFNSFRQLMLDRMAVLAPAWRERNPADLGIALVETLAYAADLLSYRQDAIATEAYLDTARRRVSARRHARLVDYSVHEGANARAWVEVRVSSGGVSLPKGTRLITQAANAPIVIAPGSDVESGAIAGGSTTFETMHDATFFPEHNSVGVYTWGDGRCCLPAGATAATFAGPLPNLTPGMVVLFEERLGPATGSSDDADPSKRCAVRLTTVAPGTDALNGKAIVDVAWAQADALPFAFTLSTLVVPAPGSAPKAVADVSVARANIVLADHGRTTSGADGSATLDSSIVPAPTLYRMPSPSADPCATVDPIAIPPRFRPALTNAPLTFAAPYDPGMPATAVAVADAADLLPAIQLTSNSTSDGPVTQWTARQHLLNSAPNAPDFVVEIESDLTASLRFGDDKNGLRPDAGTTFAATYRVGNGSEGNVPAESIAHVVAQPASLQGLETVRNPLPAAGGVDAESIEDIRRRAPSSFRTQLRAVTEDDYAGMAGTFPGVQRAVATLRWTGSWKTVFLTVDREGGLVVDDAFRQGLRAYLESFRLAGHDLEVEAPNEVSLELDITVCVDAEYFRADVERAVTDVLSNHTLGDGTRGLFHPDNFTFAQPVYLSAVYGAVQRIPGVSSAVVTGFGRQSGDLTTSLSTGFVKIERLEIARLDNDPNYPDHGVLRLAMRGGK